IAVDGLRALSVRDRHRKTDHLSVYPNRASIPPALSTAQESDSRSNVSPAAQFFQQPAKIYLLVFDAAPEPLEEDVVPPGALAVDADGDAVVGEHAGEGRTGEL